MIKIFSKIFKTLFYEYFKNMLQKIILRAYVRKRPEIHQTRIGRANWNAGRVSRSCRRGASPLSATEIVTLEGSEFAATRRSAAGKTMVASSRTGRSKGREGRERGRWSKFVGGNRQTHSQPERTSTFPVMKVPYLFILPKRLDRDISERRNGQWGRERGKINAAENGG